MAIDDNTLYGLTGAQIKELPGKIDAVKGQPKILTAADYNWNSASFSATEPYDSIAMWLLPQGLYAFSDYSTKICTGRGSTLTTEKNGVYLSSLKYDYYHPENPTSAVFYKFSGGVNGTQLAPAYITNISTGVGLSQNWLLSTLDVQDNLTSGSEVRPLSAKQGKVLNQKIEGRIIQNAGAPTTSTVGTVGMLLEDTTNGDLYICTDATNPYVWEEVGAGGGGGGGVVELTSADYDYPDANPTGVALWRKDAGMYYWKQGVNVYINTNNLHSNEESAVVFKTDAYYLDILTISPSGGKNTYTWYKVVASTGAGGYVGNNTYNHILSDANVALNTGTSNTDVMSQKAVTEMVFNDPGVKEQIRIGKSSSINNSSKSIAIGSEASVSSTQAIAIGSEAKAAKGYSVALGSHSVVTRIGEVNVGSGSAAMGYNSSTYRVIGGVYDGQEAHDAATVAQGNKLMAAAPTTTDEGVLGQLWTDTTNMHTYQCTAIDTTDPSNPVYTWTQRW